ncbi:MAG: DUF2065 family protein [Pseudomonadota bacterium]|nr:DUF2065 family protein [Pseudomonadota bacterium]
MLTVVTTLTLSLAKAMGVYMIAAGLSGFIAPDRWRQILDRFRADAALTYISGAFVFALGVAIVMAHNIWTDPLSGAVSLIGWVAAIEGIVLIVAPKPLLDVSASLMRPGATKLFAGFSLILGAALLLAGLFGRAG